MYVYTTGIGLRPLDGGNFKTMSILGILPTYVTRNEASTNTTKERPKRVRYDMIMKQIRRGYRGGV